VTRERAPFLLYNVVKSRGHWLLLRVVDNHGRDALGAELTMTVGSRTIHRDVRPAYSYLATSDPRVHFGLGSEPAARQVSVRWPDGVEELFGDVAADRVALLRRG